MAAAFKSSNGIKWSLPAFCHQHWELYEVEGSEVQVKSLLQERVAHMIPTYHKLQEDLNRRLAGSELSLIACALYVPPFDRTEKQLQCALLLKNHSGSIIWRYIFISYADHDPAIRNGSAPKRCENSIIVSTDVNFQKFTFKAFLNAYDKILLRSEYADETTAARKVTYALSGELVGVFTNDLNLYTNVFYALAIPPSSWIWTSVEVSCPQDEDTYPIYLRSTEAYNFYVARGPTF